MARLGRRSLKKITSLGKRVRDLSDGQVPGLTLVVQKSGVKSWTLRYRFGAHQRRYTIPGHDTIGALQARKIARGVLEKVAAGIDPAEQRAAGRTGEVKDNFRDQAIRFIETYSMPNNASWYAQARHLGLSLDLRARKNPAIERRWAIIVGSPADRWQKRAVGTITKREVVEMVDAATARGPIIANRVHATLTRFFSWAVEKGVIEISPTIGTKAPSPEKSRDRVLTPEELSVVWTAAGGLKAPFDGFVRLLILTAARRNEVAGMTEAEVVDDAWTLPASRSKTGEPNTWPLPELALGIIGALPGGKSRLLFTTNGRTPISGFSKMKRQLDALIALQAKIAPWRLHDLRRSAATGMASIGIEPHIVEAILGHRSGIISGVAGIYNRATYFAEKKDALKRWADAVSLSNLM